MEDGGLPEELLQSVIRTIACREQQIRQLACQLCSNLPSPPLLVVHGVNATGKTTTIRSLLKASDTASALISSRECITTRHLLERTLSSVKEALEQLPHEEHLPEIDSRCENVSVFVVSLQRLLQGRPKFILVFDAIDRQREASPTLLPALARLSESIANLTTVFVLTIPNPHSLHHAGVPHLHFPPYTRAETLSIATSHPLPISIHPIKNSTDPTSTSTDSDSAWLWQRFVTASYDSLGASVARDIISFQTLCQKLWPAFVAPILDKDSGGGGKQPGDYWPREFSKLMVKNRSLFQSEAALVDSIVPVTLQQTVSGSSTKTVLQPSIPALPSIKLPYYAAYLLIASYLTSHNPSRSDIPLLSKSSLAKKRKKRGAGTTPTHSHRNTLKTHRKISRCLLGPQPFGTERLFAVFHAILSEDYYAYRSGSAEVMGQFATLVALRLVVKAGGGGGGAGGGGMGDAVEGGGKWRCNVGWDLVRGLARGVGFVMEDFLVE